MSTSALRPFATDPRRTRPRTRQCRNPEASSRRVVRDKRLRPSTPSPANKVVPSDCTPNGVPDPGNNFGKFSLNGFRGVDLGLRPCMRMTTHANSVNHSAAGPPSSINRGLFVTFAVFENFHAPLTHPPQPISPPHPHSRIWSIFRKKMSPVVGSDARPKIKRHTPLSTLQPLFSPTKNRGYRRLILGVVNRDRGGFFEDAEK